MAGGCGNAGRTRVRQAGQILEGHEYLQPHNNNDAARSNAAGTIHGARAALNVGTGFPLLRAYAAKFRNGYFESMRGNLLRRKVNQICRTIKVRFSEKTVEIDTEKQIADLTASMVRVDGSVRVRDEKGRDVFWKFENGMSYTGFANAALSNELMRVMPGAVERLILDKDIIPKNPCGKESRHPAHSQPTDKEKFGTLHLGVWANRYKILGLPASLR